jgi:hypothetical protein
MEETIVTSIRINKEVWKEAKKKAINLDLTVAKFIESAIIHEIRKN